MFDKRKDVPLQSEVNNTPQNPYGKYLSQKSPEF